MHCLKSWTQSKSLTGTMQTASSPYPNVFALHFHCLHTHSQRRYDQSVLQIQYLQVPMIPIRVFLVRMEVGV
jgi:hypothetical protein